MAGNESIQTRSETNGLLRVIVDHNPFFLVSGVLMLAGCFMINGSVHDDPDVIWPIVGLVAVFNIYEFLIIGLAVYLARSRRFYRDAGFLLLLEVLLLCDVSLAYNELLMKSLPIGLVVSSMAMALAGVKLLIIDRGLGLKTTKAGAWMVTALIASLFVLPVVFRELRRVELIHESQFYVAWWVMGALPFVIAITQPWFGRNRRLSRSGSDRLRRWITSLLIVIPYTSLLLHLRAAYYVHDHPFRFYSLAPVVLGLTVAWIYWGSNRVPIQRVAVTACLAAAAAVGLSMSYPGNMVVPLLPPEGMIFSPLRLVLMMSAWMLAYGWWRRRAWMCLPPAVGLLFASGLGHSVSTIDRTIRGLLQRFRTLGSDLIPDTMLGWGVLAIVGSFVFLLIGAVTSISKRNPRLPRIPRAPRMENEPR